MHFPWPQKVLREAIELKCTSRCQKYSANYPSQLHTSGDEPPPPVRGGGVRLTLASANLMENTQQISVMHQFLSSACPIYNENELLCFSSLRITKYGLVFDSNFADAQILLFETLARHYNVSGLDAPKEGEYRLAKCPFIHWHGRIQIIDLQKQCALVSLHLRHGQHFTGTREAFLAMQRCKINNASLQIPCIPLVSTRPPCHSTQSASDVLLTCPT